MTKGASRVLKKLRGRLQSTPVSPSNGGDGTSGTGDGEFFQPQGIAIFGSAIYVADTGNDRIQKFAESTVSLQADAWTSVKARYR